jgi:ferrous iron transport protein A
LTGRKIIFIMIMRIFLLNYPFKHDKVRKKMSQISLVDMKPGQSGKIVAIAGGQGLRSRLQALGIRPGKKITKLNSVFRRGPVTISVDKFQVALGYGKAVRVLVEVEDK